MKHPLSMEHKCDIGNVDDTMIPFSINHSTF